MGGGRGRQGCRPAASRWDCGSHMNPEMAAAAGDGGFGPKCERGKGGLWTVSLRRRTVNDERRHCDDDD